MEPERTERVQPGVRCELGQPWLGRPLGSIELGRAEPARQRRPREREQRDRRQARGSSGRWQQLLSRVGRQTTESARLQSPPLDSAGQPRPLADRSHSSSDVVEKYHVCHFQRVEHSCN